MMMVEIYVKLILGNIKTIEEVPSNLKEKVENRLKEINDKQIKK